MNAPTISFDEWTLHRHSGELERDGVRARLQDLSLGILEELLAHPGEVVTREQLIARLWPKGVVDYDTGLNTAMRKLRIALNDDPDAPRYIETIPRKGYRFIGKIEPATRLPAAESAGERPAMRGPAATTTTPAFNPPAQSIAVLPFVNMSGDPQQEYFSDGMAEEVLNALVCISELKVAARTSAFSFKGKNMEVGDIARKLNVAAILEGSVRKSGAQVRITVKLVNAVDGYHLWSQTYDRELDNVLQVQADIATSVVQRLQATFRGAAALPRRTRSAEGYAAFLQGNYFWVGLRQRDKAIACYEQALQLDEHYAAAMAGLAWARFGAAPGARAHTDVVKARELLDRAIALDPQLADAYVTRSYIARIYDFDWAAAEGLLKRAREIEPGNFRLLVQAAYLAHTLGRFDEAVALFGQVLERDPLYPNGYEFLGMLQMAAGKVADAEASFRTFAKLSPSDLEMHFLSFWTHLVRNELESALAEAEREREPVFRLMGLAMAYHALGRKADSDAALREMIEKHAHKAAFRIAEVCAHREEFDAGMRWLEQAYQNRDGDVARLMSSPMSRTMAHDRRYQAFLRKLNLPADAG